MEQPRLLIGLLTLTLLISACSSPPDDIVRAGIQDQTMQAGTNEGETVPIDPATSTFTFEGYGPGKSHVGTFTEKSGTITFDTDGNIIATAGTIQAASVTSENDRLEEHLRSADFFDVERYPTITWESTSITDTEMVGDLTFLGVTKSITIPVANDGGSLSADFLLDTSQFGMSYTGVNKDVRIAFRIMP